jgi:hypothetical protein
MKGVHRLDNKDQLDQFVNLWSLLQYVQLVLRPDNISWNLTADGSYSAISAYEAQFHGLCLRPDLEVLWQTRVEGKIKFYVRLSLQTRNWTTDRLRARGCSHNDKCCFCDQDLENAAHLALHCPFVKEFWNRFQQASPCIVQVANNGQMVD